MVSNSFVQELAAYKWMSVNTSMKAMSIRCQSRFDEQWAEIQERARTDNDNDDDRERATQAFYGLLFISRDYV